MEEVKVISGTAKTIQKYLKTGNVKDYFRSTEVIFYAVITDARWRVNLAEMCNLDTEVNHNRTTCR